MHTVSHSVWSPCPIRLAAVMPDLIGHPGLFTGKRQVFAFSIITAPDSACVVCAPCVYSDNGVARSNLFGRVDNVARDREAVKYA